MKILQQWSLSNYNIKEINLLQNKENNENVVNPFGNNCNCNCYQHYHLHRTEMANALHEQIPMTMATATATATAEATNNQQPINANRHK